MNIRITNITIIL